MTDDQLNTCITHGGFDSVPHGWKETVDVVTEYGVARAFIYERKYIVDAPFLNDQDISVARRVWDEVERVAYPIMKWLRHG